MSCSTTSSEEATPRCPRTGQRDRPKARRWPVAVSASAAPRPALRRRPTGSTSCAASPTTRSRRTGLTTSRSTSASAPISDVTWAAPSPSPKLFASNLLEADARKSTAFAAISGAPGIKGETVLVAAATSRAPRARPARTGATSRATDEQLRLVRPGRRSSSTPANGEPMSREQGVPAYVILHRPPAELAAHRPQSQAEFVQILHRTGQGQRKRKRNCSTCDGR